jgi:hypothetical protein
MLYLSIVKLGAPELQVSEVQKGRRMPPSSYYYQANIDGYGLFVD